MRATHLCPLPPCLPLSPFITNFHIHSPEKEEVRKGGGAEGGDVFKNTLSTVGG